MWGSVHSSSRCAAQLSPTCPALCFALDNINALLQVASWPCGEPPDRAIMVARNKEDISWLDVYFNDIQHVVYNTNLDDAVSASFAGKCRKNCLLYCELVLGASTSCCNWCTLYHLLRNCVLACWPFTTSLTASMREAQSQYLQQNRAFA